MNSHPIKMKHRILAWATFWFIFFPVLICIFLTLATGQTSVSNFTNFLNTQQNESTVIILMIGLFLVVLLAGCRQLKMANDSIILSHTFYNLEIEKSNILSIERCDLCARLKSEIYTKTNGVYFNNFWSGYFIGSNHQHYFCAVASDFGVVLRLINPVKKCTFVAVSLNEATCDELGSWLSRGSANAATVKAQPTRQVALHS